MMIRLGRVSGAPILVSVALASFAGVFVSRPVLAETPPAASAVAPSAAAAPSAPVMTKLAQRRTLTLRECLQLSRQNYPKVKEARARLVAKQSQLDEAHLAPFGEVTLTMGGGVAPAYRGTTVYSPSADTNIGSNLALAYQVGIEGMVPLWTFGKISNIWTAAGALVTVGKNEVIKEQNAVFLEVRRAYYGVQLARDSQRLIREAETQLSAYAEQLRKSIEAGDGDEIDLLKVEMQRAELEARASEAAKGERIALAGLGFFVGESSPIDIPDESLVRVEHELGPLIRYLQAARLHRPEINMAKAGVIARKALAEMEHAKYFPDVGVGFTAKLSRTPDITDQRNPFAYDPANLAYAAAGLVLRWKLDFLPQSARVAKANAELEEMRATEQYALGGVAVEVEKAFSEAEDAKRRLDAWSRATQFAKQWLIKVQQAQGLGISEDDAIVEPAKEYALKKFSQMSATFDYNVAVSALAVATGWDEMLDANAK